MVTYKFREGSPITLPRSLSVHSEVELKWSDTLHLTKHPLLGWEGRAKHRGGDGGL